MPTTTRLPLVIVPRCRSSVLCTVEQGRLIEINPVPVPLLARYALADTGWIAFLSEGGRQVGRAHSDAEPGEQRFTPLTLPEGRKADTLAFHRNVLYVGGRGNKEILGLFDFNQVQPEWTPIEVPERLLRFGKSIDELFLDGDRLIAVDDIVLPKYLLLYDVTDPCQPRLLEVKDIPAHSSYESIYRGALGGNWMALLSRSMNHGFQGTHLALFDRRWLHERSCLSVETKGSSRHSTGPGKARTWLDLAWVGEVLLIAAEDDGLGVLDLRSSTPPAEPPTSPQGRRFGQSDRTFTLQDQRDLVYQSLGGRVLRVFALPGAARGLAVVQTDNGPDTIVLEMSS